MAGVYLTEAGITYLRSLMNGVYVAKESGKGLSSNDFTSSLKSLLESCEQGSEKNIVEVIKVNNAALPVTDKAVNIDLSPYAKKSDISAVMKYKGTCTYAELIAKADAQVGDVWNVSDKDGMNYACKTAATASADAWDPLGMVIDLSDYVLKSEAANAYAAKSHTHAISQVTDLQTTLNGKTSSAQVKTIIGQELVPMTEEQIAAAFNA